jgi:chaperonin GroEL
VNNAGKSHHVILNELSNRNSEMQNVIGYDAATDEYVDMIEKGIIDPVKVTRTALKNAASIAVMFLTLDAVIVEDIT